MAASRVGRWSDWQPGSPRMIRLRPAHGVEEERDALRASFGRWRRGSPDRAQYALDIETLTYTGPLTRGATETVLRATLTRTPGGR